MQDLGGALGDFPSPSHTLAEGGHRNGEAADYVVTQVACASSLPIFPVSTSVHLCGWTCCRQRSRRKRGRGQSCDPGSVERVQRELIKMSDPTLL